MTKPIAVIAVLSIFMFALEGSAAAQRHGRHVKRYPQQFYYKPPYYPRGNGYGYGNGWHPYNADRLPIGSGEWWRQMQRENRTRN
jgi:hypothetical protein